MFYSGPVLSHGRCRRTYPFLSTFDWPQRLWAGPSFPLLVCDRPGRLQACCPFLSGTAIICGGCGEPTLLSGLRLAMGDSGWPPFPFTFLLWFWPDPLHSSSAGPPFSVSAQGLTCMSNILLSGYDPLWHPNLICIFSLSLPLFFSPSCFPSPSPSPSIHIHTHI